MAQPWAFGIFESSQGRSNFIGTGSLVRQLNAGLETGYERLGVWP
jgi:hypothetical protein